MRMFTHIGAVAPLHCSGVGKVLTAWLPGIEVRHLVGPGPYPAYTPNSITTLPALTRELDAVRAQGYALDDEERELGVRCLATPIRDARGGHRGVLEHLGSYLTLSQEEHSRDPGTCPGRLEPDFRPAGLAALTPSPFQHDPNAAAVNAAALGELFHDTLPPEPAPGHAFPAA